MNGLYIKKKPILQMSQLMPLWFKTAIVSKTTFEKPFIIVQKNVRKVWKTVCPFWRFLIARMLSWSKKSLSFTLIYFPRNWPTFCFRMERSIHSLKFIKIVNCYTAVDLSGVIGHFTFKIAPGEVGVWLPWWCHPLVLPAPGSWGLFLNLIIFS